MIIFAANMKKNNIIIGIAALLMTACGGNGRGIFSGNGFDTDEAKVTKVVNITDEENAPKCHIALNVKYVKGDDERAKTVNNAIEQRLFMMDSLTMQQAVDSFALYREDKDDETKRAWYEYKYEVTTETKAGKDGCMVYIINLDMYEGGAHGISQQLVMNFDAKTGRQLKYDDIFVQGHEFRLREMLLDELKKQTDTNTLDELHAKDYLLTMDIYAPQNFILGDDEVTFIYNPYEIAPYAKGNTELTLSYSKLKDIMK